MTEQSSIFATTAARESLRLLGNGTLDDLIAQTPDVDSDVLVVGAGQTGISTAFALRRAGVKRVKVIDETLRDDDLAWQSTARNLTLRTPKTVSGPELGIPALSFRAWYEDLHGRAAFDALGRIATADWIAYLAWFREIVDVDVRRGIRLSAVEPGENGRILVHLSRIGDDGLVVDRWTEQVRKLILATGVSGTGGPHIPDVVAGLSTRRFAHTAQRIDFAGLAGRSVAVLGAGASAFDAAAVALESGAAQVHVYTRRPEVVVQGDTPFRPNLLVQDAFPHRPDAQRWAQRHATLTGGASVPADSVDRAARFDGYRLHTRAEWQTATEHDHGVHVVASDGERVFDFVIAGTGYQQDPATRPELSGIAGHIARWRDVYRPPAGLESELLGAAPYLDAGYRLTERVPGSAPWLANVHVFSIGANVSFGLPVGDIPSLRSGIPRLTEAVTRDLVLADLAGARAAALA